MPLTNPPPPVTGTPPSYFSAPTLGSENPITLNAGIFPTTTFANSTAPLYAAAGSGGGGGAVDSVSAGNGLLAAPTTGAVVVSMPNVGPGAGAIANPASITLDAQGRVSAAASLGYTPVAPAALAAYAPLAGAVFTGAVQGIAPVANADLTTKQYVDSQIVIGGGVQSVAAADASITVAGTAANPTLAVATQAGVVPGAYTSANVTVDSKGIITAVSSGSTPPTLAAGTNIALDTTTTPGTTIIKQDITSAVNMNSNEINNCPVVTAPSGQAITISGSDVNINQTSTGLGAGVGDPPSLLNITAGAGATVSAGGAVSISAGLGATINAVGSASVIGGLLASIQSTAGEVRIGGPVNYITVETDGKSMSGINNLSASGSIITTGSIAGASVAATGAVTGSSATFTGPVNGGSVNAVSGAISALAGSVYANGTGLGQGIVEAAVKVVAPLGDLDAVFTGQIQLGNNAGVNELTLIGNEPVTHIVTVKPEGAVGTAGGVVDTLINPATLTYDDATKEIVISALNGAGVETEMSRAGLSPALAAYVPLAGNAATPMTGSLVVDETTNIESKNITTALLTPLPSIGYISALGPMQVENGNFLVANPAGSEIGLAASANPPLDQVATITYNYTNDDLIHLNKFIEAPGAVLDGKDVVPLLTFKDAHTFYVSKQGSDTNSGAINAPFLTVQAAVTAALATGSEAVVDIAVGTYTENITIASAAGILLRGVLQSDRCVEGTTLKGVIAIQCNGVDNLNNNQVVISGCLVAGHIHDTSTKQHTLIVDGCRIEANAANGGKGVQVELTATTGRTFISNCVFTQEAGTTGINPLISANAGWLDMSQVQATVRAEGCAVTVTGDALITRMANCALTSDSASANPNALVFLNSTSATPHAMALTSFLYSVATSKTTPAILATRPSPGAIYATVANCVFGIAGTLAAGNVIQYGAGTALVLLVAANRSLNTAAGAYASQIQSGATVLPLSLVGETSVASVNGLSGALTVAAGSGLSLSTAGNTITLSNTRNGTVTGVGAGAGIAVDNTNPAVPVVSNTGVTRLIAGTNVSLTAETGSITISATGGGGGGGKVDSVSAGTGITLSGTAQDVIVNNAGVLSLTAQGGITNVGTAADPIIQLSGTGTVTFQDVNATSVSTTDMTSVNFPTVPGAALPTLPRQLVPKAYVDAVNTGVLTVSAGDASINIGGTPQNPTVAVAASGVSGGTYTNATVTVGADGRLTAASSGAVPYTTLNTGTGISITPGAPGTATIGNTGVINVNGFNGDVEIAAGANVVVDDSVPGTLVISATSAVSGVSGTAGQIAVANGTTAPVISLVAAGGGEQTVPYPSSIAVDDYGRVISIAQGEQTTVNGLGSAVVLAAGTNMDIAQVGQTLTFNASFTPSPAITSINLETGPALTLQAGANTTITTVAPNVIEIASTGGGGGGGITSINSETGPGITITGSGNATVTVPSANTIQVYAPGKVDQIQPGYGISVDNAEPLYPIINATVAGLQAGSGITISPQQNNEFLISASGSGGGVQSVSVVPGGGLLIDNTDVANPILNNGGVITLQSFQAEYGNIEIDNTDGFIGITTVPDPTPGSVQKIRLGYNALNSITAADASITLGGTSQVQSIKANPGGTAYADIDMGYSYQLTKANGINTVDKLSFADIGGFQNGYAIKGTDAGTEPGLTRNQVDSANADVAGTTAVMYDERNFAPTSPFNPASGFTPGPGGAFTSGVQKLIASQTTTLTQTNFPCKYTSKYLGVAGAISFTLSAAQPIVYQIKYKKNGGTSINASGGIYYTSTQSVSVPVNAITWTGVGGNTFTVGDTFTWEIYGTYTGVSPPSIVGAPTVFSAVFSPLAV